MVPDPRPRLFSRSATCGARRVLGAFAAAAFVAAVGVCGAQSEVPPEAENLGGSGNVAQSGGQSGGQTGGQSGGQGTTRDPNAWSDGMSREERLRLHRQEMLKKLEQGRRDREEAKAAEAEVRKAEAAENLRAAREKQAIGLAQQAVSEGRVVPPEALEVLMGRQTASRDAAARSVQSVLLTKPGFVALAEGERAAVEYHFYNKNDVPFTELCLAIDFPPWALEPVALYAEEFRDRLGAIPRIHLDAERGRLTISHTRTIPVLFPTGPLFTIVWEGIAPLRDSEIPFVFGGLHGTAVRLSTEDKLGLPELENDGVIAPVFRVTPFEEGHDIRRTADGGAVAGTFPEERPGEAALFLVAERTLVEAGDEFGVAIVLNNPDRALFDRLDIALRFDPAVLEAVDSDVGASIRRGINIEDAARDAALAPLDHFLANEADNATGRIVYRAAAGSGRLDGEGVVAVARFRAKTTAPVTAIVFEHPAPRAAASTRVLRLGEDILFRDPVEESALVRVLPAPPPEETGEEARVAPELSDAERAEARAAEIAARRASLREGQRPVITFGKLVVIGDESSPAAAPPPEPIGRVIVVDEATTPTLIAP